MNYLFQIINSIFSANAPNMLHLVDSNKAGKNFNNEPAVNWKSLFRSSEDSFTSSIFGLLFYLPAELFWEILKQSIYNCPDLPDPGKLIGYEFWPSWKNSGGNRVEPDIFAEFEHLDLIIEAKRYDKDQQSFSQWDNQLSAYCESVNRKENLYLLAIGGIWDGDKQVTDLSLDDQHCRVLKCRWTLLLQTITVLQKAAEKQQGTSSDIAQLNVFRDLLLAFRIHGFQTGTLLEFMPTRFAIDNSIEALIPILRLDIPIQLMPIPLNYKIRNFKNLIEKL